MSWCSLTPWSFLNFPADGGDAYEPSFIEALEPALVDIAKYRIKVAVNAGASDTKLLHKVVTDMVESKRLKLKVAWILRGYIRQLRRLEAPPDAPPGPISSFGPSKYSIPVFGQLPRGPFKSYAELSAFFQTRVEASLIAWPHISADDPIRSTKFDDSEPLVLCHLDINPRNVIVGEDNRLWLVDFGWAGYFPRWFEYVSTIHQCGNEASVEYDLKDWKAFVPFICGPYLKQEVWRRNIGIGLAYSE